MNNLIASATAAGVAEISTVPFCLIKTNYQNSNNDLLTTIKNIYKVNGLKSFYKSSTPAIASQMLSTSSKYTVYSYLGNKDDTYLSKIKNGIIAGSISSVMTHPVDVVKIHYQMSNMKLLSEFSFSLLYRGYSKTFAKATIGSSMFLPIYDCVNKQLDNSFLASGISAVISTTLLHPIDYAKTRQVYGLGFNYALRGLNVNLLRVVPHFIIMMSTIEYIKSII